jgi:uncharacterized protein YecT (DUF1311 family)
VKALSVAAVMIALLPQLASAADPYTEQYRQCMAGADSMAEKGNCGADEMARQSALVEAEYKIALGAAPTPKSKAALSKAQQAWRSFRDLDCAAKASSVDGSGAGEMLGSCKLLHARVRRLQLQHYWEL